jgi:hypothetical protein
MNCPYIKQCSASARTLCTKKFPHPAVSIGQVKPIEIGGCRISASGKLFNFPFEDSGSALFKRVGSTTLQITNSAGKNLLSRHMTNTSASRRDLTAISLYSLSEEPVTRKNIFLALYYQNSVETAAKNSRSNYFSGIKWCSIFSHNTPSRASLPNR